MNKNTLLDKICPCITSNPRAEISRCCGDKVGWESNFDHLIGGLIAKYEHQPDALIKIKKDLQSLVFELNSVINNAR